MLEIRKSGADNQRNQNTLILEVTQEHFLIGVGLMLPLQLCVFGSVCVFSSERNLHRTQFAFCEKWSLCFKEQEPSLKSGISQHCCSSMRSADSL